MTDKFKGKCLIRRSGEYVVICGAFLPSKNINTFSKNDEMWSVEFEVKQVAKFEGRSNTGAFSPEDFLENCNEIQNPEFWDRKTAL